MEATEKELEIAQKYIRGEYTEVQFNYLAHQCGSNKDRMEKIIDELGTRMPLVTAVKFILLCMFMHVLACTAYSLITFFRHTQN